MWTSLGEWGIILTDRQADTHIHTQCFFSARQNIEGKKNRGLTELTELTEQRTDRTLKHDTKGWAEEKKPP